MLLRCLNDTQNNWCLHWASLAYFTEFAKIRLSPEIMLQGDYSHLHILPRDLFSIFTRMSLDLGSIVTSSKMPPQTFPTRSGNLSLVPVSSLYHIDQKCQRISGQSCPKTKCAYADGRARETSCTYA